MKLTEANFNLPSKIAEAGLLTALKKDGKINTMTVSWGGFGILWGKEVAFVFVRPERYTYEFCQEAQVMSLSFFGEERKTALTYCGTKSGRDVDKIDACGLKYTVENGACIFKDAQITVVMKKLYSQMLDETCFVSEACKSFYKNGGYHRMYVCEVKDIIQK